MANQANMGQGVIDRVNLPAVAWADAGGANALYNATTSRPMHGKESP